MDDSVEEIPKKVREVIIIGSGSFSSSTRRALMIEALRACDVGVRVLTEKDIPDIRGSQHSNTIDLDMSPYASYRQSKGEKKRQRAFNRRFYGRDWS